jgi:hypothetical protein
MTMSNSTYDKLKFIALVLLPALATFVVTFNSLWNIPNQDAIAGTIIAVDTLLGALLGLSSKQYQNDADGYLHVTGSDEDSGMPNLKMQINRTPDELMSKKVVRLHVGAPPE